MIVDTHAHLNADEYRTNLDQVLARAKQNEVNKIIVIGMDMTSNHLAIQLAKEHEMLFATVGVHPGYVDNTTTDHLTELLKQPKVVAIGECGIDLYWRKDNLELQQKVFVEQIELAAQTKLPLIIHTRNSFSEAYECLLPFKGRVTGVFHCFSSTLEDARRAIGLGFYIGIGGPVTFKNSVLVKEVAKKVKLENLLVETDSPYLAPMPYRGKTNEPGYTELVVRKIAEIKELAVLDVARQTTKNAVKLFKLGGTIK